MGLSSRGTDLFPRSGVGIKTGRPRGAAGTVLFKTSCTTSPQGKTRHRGPSRCLCSGVWGDARRSTAVRSPQVSKLRRITAMLQCCLGAECFGVLTPPRPITLINLQMDQSRCQLPFHYPCLAFTSDRCLVGRESAAPHHFARSNP